MQCICKTTGRILVQHVEEANTFGARLLGLMFRKQLALGSGLLLEPCPQIHTCFMRFTIDVIFIDAQNRVIAVLENMRPWRMSRFYSQARRTLELPGGSLQGGVAVGEELIFD